MASPVSENVSPTESAAFRGLAEQPRIQERLAAMSPRSAILSESARPDARKPSAPKSSILAQLLETDISRKDPKDEVMRLRELLKTVEQQALDEAERSAELERTKSEAQKRVEQLAANRLSAEQRAIQAQQEVRLVQLQLENAQREIERSRRAVKEVEQQRDDAEASAARARAKARKLHEDMVAAQAREEGRRMGFQAGFEYAQAERKIIADKKKKKAGRAPSQPSRSQPSRSQPSRSRPETRQSSRVDKGKGRAPPEDIFADDRSVPRRTHTRPSVVPPPRVKTADDIIASPDSEEMSPSDLPIKGLPTMDYQSEHFPMPPPAQSTTPLNDFVPPPEEDPEPVDEYPKVMSTREPRSQSRVDMRTKTPAVQVYEIDIPPASELEMDRQYNNSMDNEHFTPQPRETWVNAESYHQIRGPRPTPSSLAPPPRNSAPPAAPSAPRTGVRFPKLSRPSLVKTKEQAASWYRTFSFRRKNKREIDPIPEEHFSPGPQTGSTMNFTSEPATATEPPVTGESQETYGVPVGRTSESWYQDKPPAVRGPNANGGAVPMSVRSGVSRRRPDADAMSVSTRVSQFDLLATPAAPHAAISMRSGKEGLLNAKKVKEKDSVLSVIREDPASRDHTPHRASGVPTQYGERPKSAIPQPDFGQRPVHHQPSAATFQTNQRASRRAPPSITVPDHDQELEPFGAVYDRALGLKQDFRYPDSNLARRPSNISNKPPHTSQTINIDVVPPSGIAPPVVTSPPHTGHNHLSPYVQYKPSAPGSLRPSSAAGPPAPSIAASRKDSKQSFAPTHAEPPRNSSALKSPYNYPNQSGFIDDVRSGSRASHRQSQSHPTPQPPSQRAPSVMSGMSKRPPNPPFIAQHYPSKSQVSLNSITADGGVRGQPVNASASRLGLHTPIQRQASHASVRSQGSAYGKFDPTSYDEPAFWGADGPGSASARPPSVNRPREEGDSYFAPVPPRPMSANSGLSYA